MLSAALSSDATGQRFKAYRIGEVLYVPDRAALISEDGEARLEPRLARLLDLLIASNGTVLNRLDILDSVWSDSGSDEALTQAISRLRRYLGRQAIETRPREGYALATQPVGEIAVLESGTGSPKHRFVATPVRYRPALIFAAGLLSGVALSLLLAPVLFSREVLVEEFVGDPAEGGLIRTQAECSLLESSCEVE